MKLPTLLDIYESPECEGIISPFIVKSEIEDLVNLLISKQEKLYHVLDCISSMTIISGKHNNTISPPAQNPTVKNNLKFDQSVGGGVLSDDAVVLPPHAVHYDPEKNTVQFESNIYQPCLRDHKPNKSEDQKAFETGKYPNDVQISSFLNELVDYSKHYIEMDCESNYNHCHCGKDYDTILRYKDILKEQMIYSWINNIRYIQVDNLVSALIMSNKMKIDPSLIESFKIILNGISSHELISHVAKLGIINLKVNTISRPHTTHVPSIFIQLTGNPMNSDLDSNIELLKNMLPNKTHLIVFTEREFGLAKHNYQIPICFNCTYGGYVKNDIPIFEMTMVNENLFIPDLCIKFKSAIDGIVSIAGSPVSKFIVAGESSGLIEFVIGSHSTERPRNYTIRSIIVNGHHSYTLRQLLYDDISECEYVKLSGKMQLSDTKDFRIFTLSYNVLRSNLDIYMIPIMLLPESEFGVDLRNINYTVKRTLPMNLRGRVEPTQKALQLQIPFTKPIDSFEDVSKIFTGYIVNREFNAETGKWDKEEYIQTDDILLSISSLKNDTLVKEKTLTVSINHVSDITEFYIQILPEVLHTTYVENGLRKEALNEDELYIHFVFDPTTENVEILEKDQIPSYKDSPEYNFMVSVFNCVNVSDGRFVKNICGGQDFDESALTDGFSDGCWRSDEMIDQKDGIREQGFIIDLIYPCLIKNILINYEAKAWPTKYSILTSNDLDGSWKEVYTMSRESVDGIIELDRIDFSAEPKEIGRYIKVRFDELNSYATMIRRVSVFSIVINGYYDAEIPPEQSDLINSRIKLFVGDNKKIQLGDQIDGDAMISWISDDPTIAEVGEDGVVTAKMAGDAIIKAIIS